MLADVPDLDLQLPTRDELMVEYALQSLQVHVGHSLPPPVASKVHYQQECMPVHTVGHIERMEQLEATLDRTPWNGRVAVIGAGVEGISIPSCIEAGRKVARKWPRYFK
jgi:oxygen-dependent protoporphyrinogen oxidase